MLLDPVRAADTRAWLLKAQLDVRSARADLGVTPPIHGDALFHCQQAVEKALKAWLTWHDRAYRKTHDLGELGLQAVEPEPALEPLLREAAPLTEYAWRFRYPGEAAEPAEVETNAGLALAERVLAARRLRSDSPSMNVQRFTPDMGMGYNVCRGAPGGQRAEDRNLLRRRRIGE